MNQFLFTEIGMFRLRKLLIDEDEAYQREIAEAQETTIERQAKMRERAKQLKEKRETSRLQVVHDKYEQRWRLLT